MILILPALVVTLDASVVRAASQEADETAEQESTFDRIWGLATLYDGDGPGLQELSFVGRYHGQYHVTHGESGEDQGWEHRRIRLGLAGRFLRDFDFKFALDMAFEDDRPTDHLTLKNGLTDAFVAYQRSEAFRAVVGKHWVRYTQEGSTSSNRILTVERSLLVNQVWPTPELLSGVMAEGRLGGGALIYRVGAYAGDKQRGLTRFEAGVGVLTSLGHSFGTVLGADDVLVRADWFYNDGHPDNDAFRNYAHVVSLGGNIDRGDFDLVVDVLAADGLEGVSDAWGFTLLPSYYLTARLQGVARYHHAASEEPGGLSAAPRHEEAAGGGVGDNYNSVYAGLNYYLYGHNLKIMSGLETSRLDGGNEQGWDGWTFFLGKRVSW
jgi:phosphate-selective porin OprO/OprP